MEKLDYQLRLDLDLEVEAEAGHISDAEARIRAEVARGAFDGRESRPEWYEEYVKLLEGGWPWRVACYMAWASSPKKGRWPETAEKLASEVLGLSGPRVIYQWRKRNPAIDETTMMLQAAPLFQHRADIMKALIESATTEGYRGFHDRRLALEMLGDYTPRSELKVGRSAKGLEGMSDAELEAWAATDATETTDDADYADKVKIKSLQDEQDGPLSTAADEKDSAFWGEEAEQDGF
jgi:hypothetical protein